ncbi:MAG: hypothetical protein RSA29_09080 [Clostridium sp.]|uniref:hypothetical protein n=2 Tax=Clostridium sp. TaxID=1506 RepID=UPI003216CECD
MNNHDIKNIFDNIKSDNSMKSRILKNVYEKVNDNTQTKKQYLSINERMMIFMNNKKIGAIALASLFLIGGFAIYSTKNNINNSQPPLSLSPPINEQYIPDKEFNNFDIDNVIKYTTEIKIKNHTNNETFNTITNKDDIDKMTSLVKEATTKEMTSKIYEKIGNSQATGNSITISFILSDDTVTYARVNLDLDIICINETYSDIPAKFINMLHQELKSIQNFQDMNKPSPGSQN